MVGELVAGAVLGTLFAELYKGFKEMRDETERFRVHLDNLNCTLDSLKPLIFQIGELNVKLDLPTLEIEDLKRKMGKGAELVGRLSQIRKREYLLVKRSYSNQLDELDRSLKILLDRLKFQEVRDVKEILLEMRKQTAKLVEMEEFLKMLVEKLNVRQEPRDAKVALLSAVESSKQLVELAASTKLLLGKPAVQRQSRNVEETRILVTSTEMALERVKENSVLKGLASLVQRTAVGTILQELFDALYKMKGKYSKLEFLEPMIEDMQAKYNNVLDHPKEELENFKMLVEKALRLLRSKLCASISYKKHKYGNQLLAILDKSLQKLLDILKVQELSNTNETSLVSVRNMETVVQRLLDV
ncbi:hypothetical protein ABKV19_007342 [Rosa sericea]